MKNFQPYKIDKRQTVFHCGEKYFDINCKEIDEDEVSNKLSNVIELVELKNMSIKDYKKNFDEIKDALKIKYDCKYNYKNLTKHVAFSLVKDLNEIEPIEMDEFDFVNRNINCSQPRYVTKKKIKLSECKLYDVNGLFPSLFCKSISIPVSKAKFSQVDEIEMKNTEIAFYNLDIGFENDLKYIYEHFDRKKTWFSKMDISAFISYGIEFKLNPGINKMSYEKSQRICFSAINELQKLKIKKNKLAKMVMTQVHGVMIQRSYAESQVIDDNCKLTHTEIKKREYFCEYPQLWRIKLVIYPFCRLIMSKWIKKILDAGFKVHRVATDSIMFPSECKALDEFLDEKKMGGFKNEIEKKFSPDDYDYNADYYFQSCMTLSAKKPKIE